MDDEAPTHPVGAMLGDRGWAVLVAILATALAAGLTMQVEWLARIDPIESLRYAIDRSLAFRTWTIVHGLAVIVGTGVVAGVLSWSDGYRPRWSTEHPLVVGVGAIALAIVVLGSITRNAQTALSWPGQSVSPWLVILGGAVSAIAITAAILGEELLFRATLQRRLTDRIDASVAIPVTVALHALFALLVDGFGSTFSLLAIAALVWTVLVSTVAGVAYDRTDWVGSSIAVRLAAIAFPLVVGLIVVAARSVLTML